MKGCPGMLTTVARRFLFTKLHLRGYDMKNIYQVLAVSPRLHRNERSGRVHGHRAIQAPPWLVRVPLIVHLSSILWIGDVFSWENPFNPLPYTDICDYIDLLWTTETQLPHALAMTILVCELGNPKCRVGYCWRQWHGIRPRPSNGNGASCSGQHKTQVSCPITPVHDNDQTIPLMVNTCSNVSWWAGGWWKPQQ